MQFYSGFCLRDESPYFDPWLDHSDYTVAGFSYGAIKATEQAAAATTRIDTLQLFSPAFFIDRDETFRRLQLRGFGKDPDAYLRRFLHRCFTPCPEQAVDVAPDTLDDLRILLTYPWEQTTLQRIARRGTVIEVYLGEADAVIHAEAAAAHFLPVATVHRIKNANHFLRTH